jgi:hypothetical protein
MYNNLHMRKSPATILAVFGGYTALALFLSVANSLTYLSTGNSPNWTASIQRSLAADNYVLLHSGGREYLLRETMNRLEQDLDPRDFVRIHRSALVRIDRIGELQPSVHGDFRVTLKSGTQLTLSRHYRDGVEKRLRKTL